MLMLEDVHLSAKSIKFLRPVLLGLEEFGAQECSVHSKSLGALVAAFDLDKLKCLDIRGSFTRTPSGDAIIQLMDQTVLTTLRLAGTHIQTQSRIIHRLRCSHLRRL
jgi:hypothetical protein